MKVDFGNKVVGGFNYEFIRCVSTLPVGSAEFGECMETMERIKDNDFDSWISEWGATAEYVESYARSQLKSGDSIAARKAFMRASNYYRTACFYAHHTDPRHRGYWGKSVDAFHNMIELSQRPIEKVEIEYEGAALSGYYMPSGLDNRPVLIAIGGFDSTKEEVYCWIGAIAREYGWNCLIFEGPGQWSALMDNPGLIFRPDYEKPVGAALDYLMGRSDIDNEKIAIIGYSMGGYLCMRGALDPRIKACIPNTLVVDCGAAAREGMKWLLKSDAIMDKALGAIMKRNTAARWGFNHSSWVLGISTASEWVKAYEKYTLIGHEEQLKGKPMLFMFSEDDIQSSAAASKRVVNGLLDYIDSLECPRYVRLFTKQEGASSHCQMGGMSYAQASIFAWLEHALCGAKIEGRDASSPALFVELFKKYGGGEGEAKAKALLSEIKFV
ncbi:MAG: alpha/beta hydrolase [Oscillospiraceae bacterium]|nr:alpha/beta hydrolase [Oscillospiraceae bacterium]